MEYQQFSIYSDDIPGFNEMINSAKIRGRSSGLNGYAWMKKKWTNKIKNIVKEKNIYPLDKIFLDLVWIEKNKRRDPDNIAAFIKFILDALQKARIIENDGWQQVAGWENKFIVGEKRGVKVRIYNAKKRRTKDN
jgi:Holliday junction resolvase RusA-like endonuclease